MCALAFFEELSLRSLTFTLGSPASQSVIVLLRVYHTTATRLYPSFLCAPEIMSHYFHQSDLFLFSDVVILFNVTVSPLLLPVYF